jgi:integrase
MPEEKKRRPRGQVLPLGDRIYGVRVPTRECGPNGRFRTHYETICGVTKRQAHRYKDKLLAQIEAGLFFSPAPLTFAALLSEWLKQKERERLSPASLDTYKDAARAFLSPYLDRLQIGEITSVTVRNLYNALQDRGLSRTTIRYARTVLSMIMRDAIRWQYLRENPAAEVKTPEGADGRTIHCLNVAEARQLIETASTELDDLIFVFALATGLRPREYLGLTWPHLASLAGRGLVRVRQVVIKPRGGAWVFRKPKTKKSVRDVPFPAALYADLMKWQALQVARRRACGAEWQDFDLVFPRATGAPQHANVLALRFGQLLKRAELPTHFTLYALRYTYATLQFIAGERDKVISDLMGHTNVDFTKNVYTKVLPAMQEQASDSLERLLFGAARPTFAQSGAERIM